MKKVAIIIPALVLAATLFMVACNQQPGANAPVAEISKDSLIKRGDYLVNTMGCDDCHSPKKLGPNGPEIIMDKRFAGHLAGTPLGKVDAETLKNGWMLFSPDLTAAVGPWGISYAANISSDETGIGNWSEAQFINSIRSGKLKGMDSGRPLLPPMPWFNFAKLTDLDLRAIYAYLKTSTPIENVVPGPKAPTDIN